MNRPFFISRVLLTVAMLGLIGLAVMAFRAQQQNSEAYAEASKESIHWSAAQVEVELSRLVSVLGRFAVNDRTVTQDEIVERFDILWSRATLFHSGEVGARLREHDTKVGIVPMLMAKLTSHEHEIMGLRPGDYETARRLAAEFAKLQPDARRLSVSVLAGEQARFTAVRVNLQGSSELTLLVSSAAVILTAVLIVVMLIETRQFERSMRDIAQLAAEANAASRAKTRFLTMMSHELRTPMNGVLGSIALVKQAGLTENQTRLIEQAERSGQQMTELLGDILDFSDLETERAQLDHAAMNLDDMLVSVIDVMEPVARRRGTRLSVGFAENSVGVVVGDEARTRQMIGHLAGYLIEVVGVDDMRIELSHTEEELQIEIAVTIGSRSRPGWRPETMFEDAMDGHGTVTSDSIGPMIAWGVVRLMNGTITAGPCHGNMVCVTARLPALPAEVVRDRIRVISRSSTSDLLITTSLENAGLPLWEGSEDPERVGVVLYEASGADEGVIVAQLRTTHPGARIIGMGGEKKSNYFDGYADIPPDPSGLRRFLVQRRTREERA